MSKFQVVTLGKELKGAKWALAKRKKAIISISYCTNKWLHFKMNFPGDAIKVENEIKNNNNAMKSTPLNSTCYFQEDHPKKMKKHYHQHRMHIQQFLSFRKQFHSKILFPCMRQEDNQHYNIYEQKPCLPFSRNHEMCNFWKVTLTQYLEKSTQVKRYIC